MIKPHPLQPMKFLAIVAVGVCLSTAVRADEESVIKYRQAVMSAISAHGKAISLNLKGKVDRNADLAVHATAIAGMAGSVGELFPEGSDFGETDALEAIWENKDDFQAKAEDLKVAADTLAGAVTTDNYDALRKTCKACHKKYKSD